MTYRRTQTLVSYWDQGRLVVENYVTRRRAPASPLVVSLLDAAASWRTERVLTRALGPGLESQGRRLLLALERATLLERRHGPSAPSLASWGNWLPHAGLLHFGTKDERYPSPRAAAREFRAWAGTVPAPAPTKSYPGAARRLLPPPLSVERPLSDTLDARRTWRRFSRAPLTIPHLSTLLGLTWGVRRWARDEFGNRVALKNAPSGGAMHPVEVYVAAFNVTGLGRGLYHYDAARHALTRVRRAGAAFDAARYLPQQPWYRGAAALFLMTAVVARERWKYPSARAYRALLVDAGHLTQTCCLVATALGLGPFCSMALDDSRIEQDLGIDGVSEVALYAAGCGTRPTLRT